MYRILDHLKIDCLPLSTCVWSLSRPCCAQLLTFPQFRVNQWLESQLWIYHLYVFLQSRSMVASKCISKLAEPQHLSAFPNILQHGLHVNVYVHSMSGSNSISKLVWLQDCEMMELDGREWQEVVEYPAVRNYTNCGDLWRLGNSAWGTTQSGWIYPWLAPLHRTKTWKW